MSRIDFDWPAVTDALDRIRWLDERIHAWAHLANGGTLRSQPLSDGPLNGCLLGVKDVIDVAGMPTRCGSPVCDDRPAQFDATCVAQLRQAGALPVGKTVTAEFAHVAPGPTRNPVDLRHTPGGSSSGSAAAVAAGMVPVALGTQTGGSMIRPAAYCGVVGFKPTYGLVPRSGMRVLCESLDVIGWYGDTVDRARQVADVLLPASIPRARAVLDGARVAFVDGHPGHTLEAAAQKALHQAHAVLIKQGACVKPAGWDLPAGSLMALHAVLMRYEFARSLMPVVQSPANAHMLSQRLLTTVADGLKVPSQRYVEARQDQERLKGRWHDWFDDAELLLTASVSGCAPAGLAHTGESGFNKGWSVLGWPCLHLPVPGIDAPLPVGVLLIGPPGSDAALLDHGAALHAALLAAVGARPHPECPPV